MKTKRLWYWTGGVVLCLIIWGLFGHFVCRIWYSTQNPVNWDKSLIQGTDNTVLHGSGDSPTFEPIDTLHSEILHLDTAD